MLCKSFYSIKMKKYMYSLYVWEFCKSFLGAGAKQTSSECVFKCF